MTQQLSQYNSKKARFVPFKKSWNKTSYNVYDYFLFIKNSQQHKYKIRQQESYVQNQSAEFIKTKK